MTDPDRDAPEQLRWEGRFIAARTRGKWEYVTRTRDVRAAVMLAIDDGHIVLIEQYRVPVGRVCLELPAGLVGDGDAGETIETAAARELEEETGYRAREIHALGEFCSSPGLVSETFTLLRCTGLERVGTGGGIDDEDITVHRVRLSEVTGFIAARRAAGIMIDVKLLLLLGAVLLSGT